MARDKNGSRLTQPKWTNRQLLCGTPYETSDRPSAA
jgi:hypothetical protein